MIIFTNAALFDGVSPELSSGTTVITRDGLIREVIHADSAMYSDQPVIDLAGKTLMPGMIDCHMHFFLDEVPVKAFQMQDQTPGGGRLPNADAYTAYRGAHSAMQLLNAGFTTVSDGGGINFVDVALREALRLGFFPGPDYYICGQQITASPGHFPGLGYETAGEWGMRKAVRDMLWWGVDHIKIKMSAPMRIPGRNTERSEFTARELEAAVDEAHGAGLQVSVHARGPSPIRDSLNAGVDIIVHGTGIDDAGIELMLKKGLYLFATIDSPPKEPGEGLVQAKTPRVIAQMREKGIEHWCSVKKAYEAGVKIVLATDAGGLGIRPGENAQEILRMIGIGMRPVEALRAATSEAAKALRIENKVGRVAPGLAADLIVIGDNPLQNPASVCDVHMVMKSGKIVKQPDPNAVSHDP